MVAILHGLVSAVMADHVVSVTKYKMYNTLFNPSSWNPAVSGTTGKHLNYLEDTFSSAEYN